MPKVGSCRFGATRSCVPGWRLVGWPTTVVLRDPRRRRTSDRLVRPVCRGHCRRLDVDPAVGLSAAEVTERRQRYGPNKLAEEAKEPGWKAFLRQYRDLMQLVLVGAAVVSIVALQDVSTGLVVLGLTVVNALMGLHQEGKAAESVAALRQMLIMTASVRRDGQLVEIPAEELVPGRHRRLRGRRQGPRRRPDPRGGDARDRRGRADRREHAGGQEPSTRSAATTCRSATGSTWPT